MKKLLILAIVLCANIALASPPNIGEVVTVGPSWKSFTNRDGSGLYHEVLKTIFDARGISVRHIYATSEEGNSMVLKGRADIKPCDDKANSPLILSKYALYENDFYVVFKNDDSVAWTGPESLSGRTIAWRVGYYDDSNFMVPVNGQPVASGASALKMLNSGRVDFWVDDLNLIRQTMEEAGDNLANYRLERAGSRGYYPVLKADERGRDILNIFEEELPKLFREGKIIPIYERWKFAVPRWDFAK